MQRGLGRDDVDHEQIRGLLLFAIRYTKASPVIFRKNFAQMTVSTSASCPSVIVWQTFFIWFRSKFEAPAFAYYPACPSCQPTVSSSLARAMKLPYHGCERFRDEGFEPRTIGAKITQPP